MRRRQHWRASPRLVALAAIALLLVGCAGKSEQPTKPRRLMVESVTLVMAEHVNDNWPVAVQLVRVADTGLLRELLAIESSAWFDGESEAFRSANPSALVESWEVVPGTVVGPISVKSRRRLAGVLFCNLRGRVPQRIERSGAIMVSIEDDGCKVTSAPPRRRRSMDPRDWLRIFS